MNKFVIIYNRKIFACILAVILVSLSVPFSAYAKEYAGSGITSNNIHDHVYESRTRVSNSYIAVNSDNTFSRIENFGDVILIETYDSSFKLKAQGTVEFELSRFGGFYDSGTYYYLIFGQDNYEQKDDREVIRIVQYTKDWKRNDSFNILGANTTVPFYGSNTDFSVIGELLYIRCGHLTYKDNRGITHQSAMTISFNQVTGNINDIQSKQSDSGKGAPENIGATYIDSSSGTLVAADHKLADPSSISIMKYNNAATEEKFQSECQNVNMLGKAFATTDVLPEFTMGGMEVSSQNILVVGNTEPSDASSNARNIVVLSVPKNQVSSNTANLSYLTGYAIGDSMSAQTPYIVKTGSDVFCILWEQKNGYSDMEKVYYAYIDGNGHRISNINSVEGCLSDCHPVVFNGKIVWYTTNGDKTRLYSISDGENSANSVSNKNTQTYITGNAVYNGVDYSHVYDYSYYCNRYPDVRVLYGNNQAGALSHFVNTGMGQGRQGSNEFNLNIYMENYPELKDTFGEDRASYYYHYMSTGYSNGYNARTKKQG